MPIRVEEQAARASTTHPVATGQGVADGGSFVCLVGDYGIRKYVRRESRLCRFLPVIEFIIDLLLNHGGVRINRETECRARRE